MSEIKIIYKNKKIPIDKDYLPINLYKKIRENGRKLKDDFFSIESFEEYIKILKNIDYIQYIQNRKEILKIIKIYGPKNYEKFFNNNFKIIYNFKEYFINKKIFLKNSLRFKRLYLENNKQILNFQDIYSNEIFESFILFIQEKKLNLNFYKEILELLEKFECYTLINDFFINKIDNNLILNNFNNK